MKKAKGSTEIFPIVKDYWSAVEKSRNSKTSETCRKNKLRADSIWGVMTDEAKRMAADQKGSANSAVLSL